MQAAELQRTWSPSVQWQTDVEEFLSAALGADRLRAISAATVTPPLATCIRVNTLRTTPEDILRRLPDVLDPEERDFFGQSGTTPHIHPNAPLAVMVPGSGPHTVDYSVTQGREVIVGRKAGESMLRGANAYAPGVLACTAGIEKGDLVAVSVGVELPGTDGYGVTRGTVLPQNIPLNDARFPGRDRLFIGVGRAEVPRTGMNPSSQGLVLTMVDRVFRTPALGDALRGDIMLQNLPSLVAAMVLGPVPGARVLDMCAAPGGKTTAMAQLMGDCGEIVALDRSHGKVVGIEELAKDLGITCIRAYKADATKAVRDPTRVKRAAAPESSAKSVARMERIAAQKAKRGEDPAPPARAATTDGFEPESFDYVLLDAPCTALGLRPRLVLSQTMEELRSTALYQRRFIDAAVRLVRPGGYLVFSTCTISPLENEANVRYLLDKYAGVLELAPQEPRLGAPGLTGACVDDRGREVKLLSVEEAALVQRFDPSAELDTIGFFISKFRKIASMEGQGPAANGACSPP